MFVKIHCRNFKVMKIVTKMTQKLHIHYWPYRYVCGRFLFFPLSSCNLEKLFTMSFVSGGTWTLFHGHFYRRDVHQDSCNGLRFASWFLPSQRLEHHGLHCCGVGVSLSCLFNKFFNPFLTRFLPMLMPKSEDGKATGPDLSTLRTVRVLRPLKLVSGVPSK